MTQRERPLSPHIQIYQLKYTFFSLSILHRASGVFMSAGIVMLVYWLVAIARGADQYAVALRCFSAPLTQVFLFGWLAAFYYHFCNGIRHLGWDLGFGFEKAVAKKTGVLVLVVALVLTLLTWWCVSARITAMPTGGLV